MSLGNLLNVSKLGIFASQGALQTISHNITNANTPGYSRQTVDLVSVPGNSSAAGGTGVKIADVKQQLDQLVDRRLELGTGELGRLQTRDKYMKLIENVFNDMDGNGLSEGLNAFYDAADTLADNPGNAVARYQMVSKADSLAKDFNQMSQSLNETTLPMDKEIGVVLQDVNSRLKAIQEINNTIVRNEATNPSLDLKDQRRKMLLELGKIIDIRTVELDNGDVQVMTSKGQELLADSVYSATFGRSITQTATGFQGIKIDNKDFDQEKVAGGQLGGLLELRDKIINGPKGFLTQLETLADEIRFQVNKVNSQAVGKTLVPGMTGVVSVGNDLDTALSALVTDITSANYQKGPVDANRVVSGTITFATGTADNLKPVSVEITTSMTLNQIQKAIDDLDGVKAEITPDKKLKISAENAGSSIGVVVDGTGFLAALGVGALLGGRGAGDMAVNPALLADPDLVGVGKLKADNLTAPTKVTFDDANSQGALAMGSLRNTKFALFGNNATLTSHYANMVGDLGAIISQDQESLTAQDSAQSFISDMRDSISGVSLEEELTDLIRFQRAFQASSKMVGVADELMQTIIQMVA
ncbi:MAG: flagellar hook-associated protein FlgK [Magnetococcales bacterium]|nr:flagellar hook-associated protein FlgK [Magnetococcales bacterium]